MQRKAIRVMVMWSMQMFGVLSCALVMSCSQLALMATPSLPSDEMTNGSQMRGLFSAQREVLQQSSAVLYDGWMSFNYGIVVRDDGYVLVKASELLGRKDLIVRIGEEKFTEARVVAQNPRWDVALIKVEAQGLKPIQWAKPRVLEQGTMVVANGASSRKLRRLNWGVVSAKERKVPGLVPAVLGVIFESKKNSLLIAGVNPSAGAHEAGVLEGDVVLSVAGESVDNRSDLIEILRDYQAGESVTLKLQRGEASVDVRVELMSRDVVYEASESRNDAMSGAYSKRRDGFPLVMQTDIPFNERTIGGPLLGMDGRCVGMNIARANRAESFAIPVGKLLEILADLYDEIGE